MSNTTRSADAAAITQTQEATLPVSKLRRRRGRLHPRLGFQVKPPTPTAVAAEQIIMTEAALTDCAALTKRMDDLKAQWDAFVVRARLATVAQQTDWSRLERQVLQCQNDLSGLHERITQLERAKLSEA